MTEISIIGDLHGYFDRYVDLLQNDDLIDSSYDWQGGDRHLWLIGDIFDRGPEGIKCLDLTIKLQSQASQHGGYVQSLLGNHEMMILCAFRMMQVSDHLADEVKSQWLNWGGIENDLKVMEEKHADWLTELPAMAILGPYLLMHSDCLAYISLGKDIASVNQRVRQTVTSPNLQDWIPMLSSLSERKAFSDLSLTGAQRAKSVLKYFGGNQIIHGHTPISNSTDRHPRDVVTAYTYANDLCVNVDGGIYMGGPGFVHRIEVMASTLSH